MNPMAFRYLKGAYAVFVMVSLTLIIHSNIHSNKEKVRETSASFFKEIVTTRAWNAQHGGVYVFVDDKTQPNPDLITPLRDLYTTDSQMLTLINPAYMTRQISELAAKKNDILYHITSNNPLRIQNSPDPWEAKVLSSFKTETDFAFERDTMNGKDYYRFMAPLMVDQSCMTCHAKQGYKVGEVRGGISVSIESATFVRELRNELILIILLHLIFLSAGLYGIYFSEKTISRQFKLSRLKSQQLALHKNRLTEINMQLTDLNHQKEKFLSIIAHDLKNPVGAIMGLSEVLVDEIESADFSHKKIMLNQLHKSAVNTYNLMENLLTWSRSQQGKMEYQPKKLILKEEIEKAVDLVTSLADAKLVDCFVKLGKFANTEFWADENMFNTTLRNLLTNAIKFTPNHGSVKISTKLRKDNFLEIQVSDTGVGISPDKIDNLFRIEKNISTPGTNNEKGTGLGMILVKEFVEKNKGTIDVKSQVGTGTTITFTVPTIPKNDTPQPQNHISQTIKP